HARAPSRRVLRHRGGGPGSAARIGARSGEASARAGGDAGGGSRRGRGRGAAGGGGGSGERGDGHGLGRRFGGQLVHTGYRGGPGARHDPGGLVEGGGAGEARTRRGNRSGGIGRGRARRRDDAGGRRRRRARRVPGDWRHGDPQAGYEGVLDLFFRGALGDVLEREHPDDGLALIQDGQEVHAVLAHEIRGLDHVGVLEAEEKVRRDHVGDADRLRPPAGEGGTTDD